MDGWMTGFISQVDSDVFILMSFFYPSVCFSIQSVFCLFVDHFKACWLSAAHRLAAPPLSLLWTMDVMQNIAGKQYKCIK